MLPNRENVPIRWTCAQDCGAISWFMIDMVGQNSLLEVLVLGWLFWVLQEIRLSKPVKGFLHVCTLDPHSGSCHA